MHRVSWIIVGLLLLIGIASAVDYVVIGINGAWINSSSGTLNIGSNINMDGRNIIAAANVNGTNMNATNYTTSQGRHLENGGCDASYCIRFNLTNSSIIEAINGSTGEADYVANNDIGNVTNQTYRDGKPKYVSVACGNYTLNEKIVIGNDQSFFAPSCVNITLGSGVSISAAFETVNFASLQGQNKWLATDIPTGFNIIGGFYLNGNKAQATANGTNIYGKRYRYDVFVNDFSGTGLYSEAGATVGQVTYRDEPETKISGIFRNNSGHGVLYRGPHDGYFDQIYTDYNGLDGLRLEYLSGAYNGYSEIRYLHSYSNDGVGFNATTSQFTSGLVQSEGNERGNIIIGTNYNILGDMWSYNGGGINITGAGNIGYIRSGGSASNNGINVSGARNKLYVALASCNLCLNLTGNFNTISGGITVGDGIGLNLSSVGNIITLVFDGGAGVETYVVYAGQGNNIFSMQGYSGGNDFGFNGTLAATDYGNINLYGLGQNSLQVSINAGVVDFGTVSATSNTTRPNAPGANSFYINESKTGDNECQSRAAGQNAWSYRNGSYAGGGC